MRTTIFAAIAMIAVAPLLSACGQGHTEPKSAAPPPPQVTVAKPVTRQIADQDEYVGRFVAIESVEVRARVSGYLDAIHFQDGQVVRKGDLLFTIDRRPFETALAQAQASLEQARANLAFAEADLKRAQSVAVGTVVTQQTLDQRTQTKRVAQANVAAQEQAVRQAALDLEFTELRAPVDGSIGDRRASIGNLVTGGTAGTTLLATIESVDPIRFGAAPALAAMLLLISWKSFELSNIVATIGTLVLIYALADWAQKQGKALETHLYAQMDGKPSVAMMFRTDTTIDRVSKDRYRAFLAGKLSQPAPTEADEQQNPDAAKAFYELAGNWLRDKTRDAKKFSILFNDNCTYGFRRNLLGVKWPALGLNVIVFAICAGLLWYRWPIITDDDMTARIIVVLVVAAAHATYFLFGVRPQNVMAAARAYGRQLILSCETFIPAPRATPKPKGKAAA